MPPGRTPAREEEGGSHPHTLAGARHHAASMEAGLSVGCPLWPHIRRKGRQVSARRLAGMASPQSACFGAEGRGGGRYVFHTLLCSLKVSRQVGIDGFLESH